VPTAVPLQTGRTNYVDNDRIGAAAGVDYAFRLWGVPFRAGARAQLHVLRSRYQAKLEPTNPQRVRDEFPDDAVDTRGNPIADAAGLQTNNPGWPGFSSSGFLVGGGLSLALLL
jgi:long-chain fatty acid transport protein